jgi:HD-GYP domain-containing protein (c-di-GMP phosphodiesterase class II)
MTSELLFEDRSAPEGARECVAVSVAALAHFDEIDFDLYTLSGSDGSALLFCRRGLDEFNAKIRALGGRGPTTLYVKRSEGQGYRVRLREKLPTVLTDESIALDERFDVLRSVVGQQIERSYRLVNVAEAVRHSREVGEHVTRMLTCGRLSPRAVFRFLEHDPSTFTHVLNVSSYAVLLAQSLGIHAEDELEEIAVGGMLHDIGKRTLPRELLNKAGPLTRDERATIRTHSQAGYETLFDREELGFTQLMMVYQHHERWDGTGYPVRLVGREIDPMARLTAIVDVFDALTGERPYRKAMRGSMALEFLRDQAGQHFDREMVACWTSAFSR